MEAMKKFLFLLVNVFFCFLLSAQGIHWKLVFEDNFDGTTLDTTVWYDTRPWGQYHPSVRPIIFLPENVSVHDGYLWLTLKKDGNRYYVPNLNGSFRYPYSAGMIWSKKHFKYGFFEARIKIPEVRDLWSAFWLYGSGQYGDEIDIFEQCPHEIINNEEKVYLPPKRVNFAVTIHNLGKAIVDNNYYHTKKFLKKWHTYKLRWGIRDLDIYIDDNLVTHFEKDEYGYIRGSNVKYPENAENIIFNISQWGSISSYPQMMLVDYIRVWQEINCDDELKICNYNEFFDHSIVSGRIIEVGGDGCNVVVPENKQLEVLATQEIHIKPGFSVKKGGNFVAKIVPCSSYPQKMGGEKVEANADEEVKNIRESDIFEISPNPFSDYLYVSINEMGDSYIEVYDLLGKMRHYEKIYSNVQKINLTHLEKGVYIIKLIINQNMVSYEKVVKM
jgi:beta-glucanase (GH16 family)